MKRTAFSLALLLSALTQNVTAASEDLPQNFLLSLHAPIVVRQETDADDDDDLIEAIDPFNIHVDPRPHTPTKSDAQKDDKEPKNPFEIEDEDRVPTLPDEITAEEEEEEESEPQEPEQPDSSDVVDEEDEEDDVVDVVDVVDPEENEKPEEPKEVDDGKSDKSDSSNDSDDDDHWYDIILDPFIEIADFFEGLFDLDMDELQQWIQYFLDSPQILFNNRGGRDSVLGEIEMGLSQGLFKLQPRMSASCLTDGYTYIQGTLDLAAKLMSQGHIDGQDEFNFEDQSLTLIRKCNFLNTIQGTLILNGLSKAIGRVPIAYRPYLMPFYYYFNVLDLGALVSDLIEMSFSFTVLMYYIDAYNLSLILGHIIKILVQFELKGMFKDLLRNNDDTLAESMEF